MTMIILITVLQNTCCSTWLTKQELGVIQVIMTFPAENSVL